MVTVTFAKAFHRHVTCPPLAVEATTVRAALDAYYAVHPRVRSYVEDDQGAVRKHISVFVAGAQLRDRTNLTDPLGPDDTIDIYQALSGG